MRYPVGIGPMRANLPEDGIQSKNLAGTLFETCVVCHASNAENFCAVHDRLSKTNRKIWQIRRCRDCGFGWTLPHLKPKYWYYLDAPRHIYHFSKSSPNLLLEQAHFSICQHLSFSRDVNFHSLKHSLLSWSEDRFGSCVPYYLLKPGLLIFCLIESLSGKSGILTIIARKVR
jgi:hypothetical protein